MAESISTKTSIESMCSESINTPHSILELVNNPRITELKQKLKKYKDLLQVIQTERSQSGYVFKERRDSELKRWKEVENEVGIDMHSLEVLLRCEINKQAGLNPESLRKIDLEYMNFLGVKNEKSLSRISPYYTAYVPILAMIRSLYGQDLRGKVIVEIGAGHEGRDILAYFASLGAKVIALDVDSTSMISHGREERYKDVESVIGRWENLSSLLNGQTVDIIFTHNMHPHPWVGGDLDNETDQMNDVFSK
ncbi:hypothetical protein IT397_00100, partial [Candidatus Nomurabacteria bacterium]|nr:hypothetical protein [Candidatus Nomurabacteria bacterium]